MQIAWRELLDAIGVEWTDRGRNTSRVEVNIQCPFCGVDDPSYHMGIGLYGAGFSCLRDPRHAGSDLVRLLVKLGVDRREAIHLLSDYNLEGIARPPERREPTPASPQWDKFVAANDHKASLAYLRERGFPDPALTAARYDLRRALAGKWVSRLLFPIKQRDDLVSWTGRALIPNLNPKYLMRDGGVAGLVYVPRPPRETVLIVEGPMDALKVAVGTEALDVSAVALLGKGMSIVKLRALQRVLVGCKRVFVALDEDVHLGYLDPMIAGLAAVLRGVYVARLSLPDRRSDPAEIAMGEMSQWIKHA